MSTRRCRSWSRCEGLASVEGGVERLRVGPMSNETLQQHVGGRQRRPLQEVARERPRPVVPLLSHANQTERHRKSCSGA